MLPCSQGSQVHVRQQNVALITGSLAVRSAGFGPLREDAPSGREETNSAQTHMDPFPLYPTIHASPTSTVSSWASAGVRMAGARRTSCKTELSP